MENEYNPTITDALMEAHQICHTAWVETLKPTVDAEGMEWITPSAIQHKMHRVTSYIGGQVNQQFA